MEGLLDGRGEAVTGDLDISGLNVTQLNTLRGRIDERVHLDKCSYCLCVLP